MEKEYLKKEHLDGFDNYKYSCKDTGILSIYVMHPFWNWLVQFCPKSIAPNLLTFSGFLFAVATVTLFTWLDYSFYASDPDSPDYPPIPRWAFATGGIFLFLAYTLDGIDGKQARRTQTSGPLGELFDHGLDSYTVGLVGISTYSLFGRGERYSIGPYHMFFMMWNILLNFYLSHWEKYNTGILFLPWGYDFSMWGTIFVFIITGIFGHEMWHYTLPGGVTNGTIFELILYISALLSNVPVVLYNIYKSYRDRTGHMRPFSEAIRPLVPISVFFILSLFWIKNSPSDILNKDPRAIYYLLGIIFSNISCRLIVAQMSHTRCDAFNWLLVPTSAVILISLISKVHQLELCLTYILCVFSTIAHVHYGSCVVRQMCRHFNINCFSIKVRSE